MTTRTAPLLALALLLVACGEERPEPMPSGEAEPVLEGPDTRTAPGTRPATRPSDGAPHAAEDAPATQPAPDGAASEAAGASGGTASTRAEGSPTGAADHEGNSSGSPSTAPATAPAGAPPAEAATQPSTTPAAASAATAPATRPATRSSATVPSTRPASPFERAVEEVLALERELRFAQALRRLRELRGRFNEPAQRRRLNEIADRLQKARREAPQLRYALEQMGSGESRHVSVAGRQLLEAGEVGRVFLRKALREKGYAVAGEAALLLTKAGDPKAPELFLDRLADAENPWFRRVLLKGLRRLASELEPAEARRLYRRLRNEEKRFARHRVAGVLHAYRQRACGDNAGVFNRRLGDPGAAKFLEQYIKDARRADDPAVRQWAFDLSEGLYEKFNGLAGGARAHAIPGWREGSDCADCRIEAQKFADTARDHVFFMNANAGDDWQRGLLHEFGGTLSGRVTLEFKYWETSRNHDGNLWVADTQGEPLIGVGTENPQWEVVIRGKGEVVSDGGNGDDYEHWIHVVLEIDTKRNRARATFEDTADGTRKRYGWFELPSVDGLTKLGVGPDNVWYVDDIRAYAGPPR